MIIPKVLFPPQVQAVLFFLKVLLSGRNTLDSSNMGTGKTIVACHLARDYGKPVAIIAPKAVLPSWEREMEEVGIKPVFILNLEKLKTGNTKYLDKVTRVTKTGKKFVSYSWNEQELPTDTLILLDEVHKCKGMNTTNSKMAVALVDQGYRIHCMSGTPCEDASEMKALGYILGLHANKHTKGVLYHFWGFMKQMGVTQDKWGSYKMTDRSKLALLRSKMYGVNTHRLTVADFPDSFRNNRVYTKPINFRSNAKIQKAYDDIGLTPKIIDDYINKGTVTDSEYVLVNLLRARQLAESYKAVDLAEMAENAIAAGKSVVLFVNFSDTVEALTARLNCGKIDGSQTPHERQFVIDEFQRDESHCIVCNISAGGTGISLHDIQGMRPRVSFICPTFNSKDYQQVLGRIHRNGAKSDAIQQVLVAANSIEEHVMKSIIRKIANHSDLHE
tara:strand:- start:6266 stop:7600 length:1335 start_codon:yes stop_codon:yes gene_type:complete